MSDRDGNAEIYVVNADGSGLTNLTRNPALDQSPAWSTEGDQLAFTSDRDDEEFDIYTMSAGGGEARRLIARARSDHTPAWSPDGTQIAFACGFELCVADAQSGVFSTVPDSEDPSGLLLGDWSSDAGITYFWGVTGQTQEGGISAVKADGSDRKEVIPAGDSPDVYSGEPDWSPDGQRLAFSSNRDGNWEIYTREPDGSLTRLTDDPAADGHPSWSPDGNWIAFSSDRGDSLDIYIMRSDGSDLRRLTDAPALDLAPAWADR